MIMNETLTKKFPSKGGGGTYAVSLPIDRFKASDEAPLATRGKHDRKYNIKMRQDDLVLLDALAGQKNIPRSVLLNNLLHEILFDELMSVQEHDVRLLLAQTADSLAHYDGLSHPWVVDAIQTECRQIVENINHYNRAEPELRVPLDETCHSENFFAIKEVLEQIKK
jgi:hypothetical protein